MGLDLVQHHSSEHTDTKKVTSSCQHPRFFGKISMQTKKNLQKIKFTSLPSFKITESQSGLGWDGP